MREIKFRVWDKVRKRMRKVCTMNWNDIFNEEADLKNVWFVSGQKIYDSNPLDEIELMQYTGLKDKNGVEIYEGDIVERKYSGNKAEIKFIEGQFSYCDLVDDLSVKYPNCHDIRTLNTWGYEVIGNIYQNPELIK